MQTERISDSDPDPEPDPDHLTAFEDIFGAADKNYIAVVLPAGSVWITTRPS